MPLIFAWPGVTRPGSVCEVPVSGQDLYPTLREIAGVAPTPGQIVNGESLVPLLRRTGTLRRDSLFWHYPHYSNQGGKPGGAIRQGNLKLIEWYEDGRIELYNLAADMGEQKDLAGESPADVERLRGRLARWRESVAAQMPTPNPQYSPAKSEQP